LKYTVIFIPYDLKYKTRKLSYRKDDRAMRPMFGCPENFRETLTSDDAHGYFSWNFNGLCSDWARKCTCKIWSS